MEDNQPKFDPSKMPVEPDATVIDGLIKTDEEPKPKKPGRTLAIALASTLLGILVIGGGAVLALKYLSDQQDDSSDTTTANTSTTKTSTDTASSTSTKVTTSSESTVTTSDGSTLSSKTATAQIGNQTLNYNGAYVVDGITVTIDGGEFASTEDDQNVFLVINGGQLTISNAKITKSGSENFSGRGDSYSFYGLNSAVVVVGENSSATLNNVVISTTVSGANAVVATDGGTTTISNSQISTTKDNSRGLHATYEGKITASSVEIATLGGSCASLATDRGAGTVVADKMTLSTAGAGSPLIYSTGDITVTNSTGTATGAQIAVVEGKNSITIEGSQFSANGIGNRNNVDNAGVMIYQSMSGDASVGTGSFTAKDSTLTVLSSSSQYAAAPFFFVTNTDATISLTNVTANFSADQVFIKAAGTSEWGKSGQNGGNVTVTATSLTATNQTISADDISSVSGL